MFVDILFLVRAFVQGVVSIGDVGGFLVLGEGVDGVRVADCHLHQNQGGLLHLF